MQNTHLDDDVIVITGAARGIGLSTARLLKSRGARVVGIDRLDPEDGEPFAEFITADITDHQAMEKTLTAIHESTGALKGLVNNAAVVSVAPFLESTVADLDAAYSVNIRAVFGLMQTASRLMMKSGGGSIVNLASVNGERGVRNTSAYSATKGAVAALTRVAAVELAPHGIRCNAVAPAPTGTRRIMETLSKDEVDLRAARIPFGRLATPEEIAGAISYLLSADAAFITGVVLPADGGYLAFGS